MKKLFKGIGIVIGIIVLLILTAILLTPWMDKKGTTAEERQMLLPGDELLSHPLRSVNRGITIQATPAKIYAWIIQTGADKSGMYSYTWLENLVGCKMAKVEQIKPEWQQLQTGDLMKMCAGDFAPPPYQVALLVPDSVVVFGHQDKGEWVELWTLALLPQAGGSTRLIARTQTNMVGGMWEIIRPISFVMEQKMLSTIRNLSESGK
ncbi:MAG: hypothetical protein ACYDH1_17200 [Anaerolineaceae bacterium]